MLEAALNLGLPTSPAVLRGNRRAKDLYERLGFEVPVEVAHWLHLRRDADDEEVTFAGGLCVE